MMYRGENNELDDNNGVINSTRIAKRGRVLILGGGVVVLHHIQ